MIMSTLKSCFVISISQLECLKLDRKIRSWEYPKLLTINVLLAVSLKQVEWTIIPPDVHGPTADFTKVTDATLHWESMG